jgi:hypothetical protein
MTAERYRTHASQLPPPGWPSASVVPQGSQGGEHDDQGRGPQERPQKPVLGAVAEQRLGGSALVSDRTESTM